MFPLPLIAVGGVLLTLLSWFGFSKLRNNSKIIVLGPSGSGKTTLVYFLKHGKIRKDLPKGVEEEKVHNITIGDKKINVIIDTIGTNLSYKTASMDAYKKLKSDTYDYAFYMFNLKRSISDEDFKNTIFERDIPALSRNRDNIKKKIIFIGTHEDLITSSEKFAVKKFLENLKRRIEENGIYNFSIITGSLNDEKNAEKLIRELGKNL
jgi:GTPase SAR1 family protein